MIKRPERHNSILISYKESTSDNLIDIGELISNQSN
jgi:hypothetical protein